MMTQTVVGNHTILIVSVELNFSNGCCETKEFIDAWNNRGTDRCVTRYEGDSSQLQQVSTITLENEMIYVLIDAGKLIIDGHRECIGGNRTRQSYAIDPKIKSNKVSVDINKILYELKQYGLEISIEQLTNAMLECIFSLGMQIED